MTSIKKVICVMLAVIMAFSAFSVSVFATDVKADLLTDAPLAPEDEKVATIIMPGIGQSDSSFTTESGNTVSGGLILLDDEGLVGKILKTLALPLIASILTQKVDEDLPQAVYDTICDLFYIQASDKEGNAKNDLVLKEYPYSLSNFNEDDKGWFYRMIPMEPVIDEMNEVYGANDATYNAEDYVYLYTFQLISDPMLSAQKLFDYIQMVKDQTKCTKVNLVSLSLGGTIMTAYCDLVMEKGGDFSDINKIVNVVACLNGTDLFADFYAREWNLADEFLYDEYIDLIVEANGLQPYMSSLIKIVLKIIPKQVLYTILTGAIEGILDTLIVNCPQFWAMVPGERYEGLADRYLVGDEYAVLRTKTDRFQQARLSLDKNLVYANENYGVGVYTVAAYGLQFTDGEYNFFGITGSSATTNSDGIIDISSASLGATYTVPGEKVENAVRPSPDGELDISTCLFPDTTWFFKNQHHEVGRNDVILKLFGQILTDQITDVNSDPENYPQFNYGRVTRELTREGRLMDKAEEVIANVDGKYTQEQIDEVKPAYEKAVAMLSKTVLNENSAKEAEDMITELNDALACTGLTSKTEGPGFMDNILTAILGVAEKVICR